MADYEGIDGMKTETKECFLVRALLRVYFFSILCFYFYFFGQTLLYGARRQVAKVGTYSHA